MNQTYYINTYTSKNIVNKIRSESNFIKVQKYKPNISGKKRLISIIKPAVNDIQIVRRTGAVDKYF